MPVVLTDESKLRGGEFRIGPLRVCSLRPALFPLLLCVAVLAVIGIGVNGSSAAEIAHSFSLTKDAVIIKEISGVAQVSVRDGGYCRVREEGIPDLPFKVVSILLPQGHEIERYTFTSTKRITLRENTRVRMTPALSTTDRLHRQADHLCVPCCRPGALPVHVVPDVMGHRMPRFFVIALHGQPYHRTIGTEAQGVAAGELGGLHSQALKVGPVGAI